MSARDVGVVIAGLALELLLVPPLTLGILVLAGVRPRGRLLRLWWWYGYHLRIYWLSWRWQAFRSFRNGTRGRCPAGHWNQDDDGLWRGVRCAKLRLHVGSHEMRRHP